MEIGNILMRDGRNVPANQIRLGDYIEPADASVARIRDVFCGGIDVTYQITARNQKMVVVAPETVFSTNQGPKRADELEIGDKLAMLDEEEVPVDSIKVQESENDCFFTFDLEGAKWFYLNDFVVGSVDVMYECQRK